MQENSEAEGFSVTDNRRIPGKDPAGHGQASNEQAKRRVEKNNERDRSSPWFRIIVADSSKRCRPAKDRHACQEALGYLS